MSSLRNVTIEKFADMSGYTADAVRSGSQQEHVRLGIMVTYGCCVNTNR